jgi:hypothetical protein
MLKALFLGRLGEEEGINKNKNNPKNHNILPENHSKVGL